MSPLSLIPAPYNLIAKVALPVLAIGGAWVAGDVHGGRAAAARVLAKYQPRMEHAADVMQLTAANIRSARADAAAADQANARRVERAQAQATQETARAYDVDLAAARAAAAAYARRLRDGAQPQAAGAGGSAAGDARPADASRPAAGARAMPELDDQDLLICSENTVKAIGWRAWWQRISAIPR